MDYFDLDEPLISLVSTSANNSWTIRNAVEGVQIFGGIGSGKTSGSGRMLALKYLLADFGGLVLTVKKEECDIWKEFSRETGREDDLIILEPGGKHHFNFLEYESINSTERTASVANVVEVLKTVIAAGQELDGGKGDDSFWEQSLDLLLFNTIDLCKLAYGKVSIQTLYDIVQSIPKEGETPVSTEVKAFQKTFEVARVKVVGLIDSWFNSLPYQEQLRLNDNPDHESILLDAVPEARLMKFIDNFFMENFRTLSSKTRSIIEWSFTNFLFHLLRDPVYSLFCRYSSTFTPEDSIRGKIIILNLPVKEYHKVGRDCQILFKYIWQRAMEKRDVRTNPRPVFLYSDEAQHFLHPLDSEVQATARSSRIATVYLTQNINNYMASMGGQRAEYRVKSFLGTLATKIFHANADIETNKYASELIGDGYIEDVTESTTFSEKFSSTKGVSLRLERRVRPEQFVSIKTGGPLNNYHVEGYLHKQGNPIMNGQNHVKMTFSQQFKTVN